MPRGEKINKYISDWKIAEMVECDDMNYPDICKYIKGKHDVKFHPETVGSHYRGWTQKESQKENKSCLRCVWDLIKEKIYNLLYS